MLPYWNKNLLHHWNSISQSYHFVSSLVSKNHNPQHHLSLPQFQLYLMSKMTYYKMEILFCIIVIPSSIIIYVSYVLLLFFFFLISAGTCARGVSEKKNESNINVLQVGHIINNIMTAALLKCVINVTNQNG